MVGRRWVHVAALLGAGCVPSVVESEPEDETSAAGSEAGPVTTMGPATDSLGGTGMLPPATDGTTSMGVDDSGGSSSGDPAGDSTGLSTTGPTDPSTSDGTDPSSDTGGTSGDATDTSDTDDTSDVVCEDDVEMVSCDGLDDSPSIFNAIGLGCEGDAEATIPIGPFTFPPATDPDSYGIATQFGTHVDEMGVPAWGPREGGSFLVLSSGTGVEPDEDGLLSFGFPEADGPNTNPDASPLPAPVDWSMSGPFAMPEFTVNDLVWFQVDIEVPPGVSGFAIDMAFFSAEFPESVGTTFNDGLSVWVDNGVESYETCATYDGDIICTVAGLWPTQYGGNDPELDGTGFTNDGGLGWRTLRGPVIGGETMQLTVSVFDTGDTINNTIVLLDAFRWECDGCDGTPGNECFGFEP